MKTTLLTIVLLLSSACTTRHWQACGVISKTGEVVCGSPQDRRGAELKALAINATSQGEAVAWTQKIQNTPKPTYPQTSAKIKTSSIE